MKLKPRFFPERGKEIKEKVSLDGKKVNLESAGTGGSEMDDEEAKRLAEEYADKAVEKALTKKKKKEDDSEEGGGGGSGGDFGINPRALKALENMANAFGAMKKVFSNPLQEAVENKVGGRAAEIVERAFTSPSAPAQPKDLVETVLNSQFAFGLGSGLGQRGPELVDTFTKNFGQQKAEQYLDSVIGRRNTGGSGGGGIGSGSGGVGSGQLGRGGGGNPSQSDMELVLSLDPNNPEHVAAYATSQGGMSVDAARKVLMIHQDDFIKQLELQGADATQYKLRRNQQMPDLSKMYRDNLHGNETYGGAVGGTTGGVVGGEGGEGGVADQDIYQNVQEYRPPIQRSQELIPSIPKDEDKRWDEKHEKLIDPNEEKELKEKELKEKELKEKELKEKDGIKVAENGGTVDIVGYLKDLSEQLRLSNDYTIGLKDMIEKQNNTISEMQNELNVLKQGRANTADEIKEKNAKEKNVTDRKDEVGIEEKDKTGVKSVKTIRRGYSHIKTPDDVGDDVRDDVGTIGT